MHNVSFFFAMGFFAKEEKTLTEYVSDFALFLILTGFSLYSQILTVVYTIFFTYTKKMVDEKLAELGIIVDGPSPTDIQVINGRRFYTRVAIERSYGLMEGRLDGDWDIEDFRGFVSIIFSSRRHAEFAHPLAWIFKAFNLQTKARAFEVGKSHYDDGEWIRNLYGFYSLEKLSVRSESEFFG